MKYYILLGKGEDFTVNILNINGVNVNIEWAEGDIRYYDDTDFKTLMTASYGYLRNTTGADGDKLDVYVGRNHSSKKVFKLRQQNPKTKKYDETKWMLGFWDINEAKQIYLEMMPFDFFMDIEEVPWSEFYKKVPKSIVQKSMAVGNGMNEGTREKYKEYVRSGKKKTKFGTTYKKEPEADITSIGAGINYCISEKKEPTRFYVNRKRKGGKAICQNLKI